MQACQLCGAKSWGALDAEKYLGELKEKARGAGFTISANLEARVVNLDGDDYVACDNCHTIAKRSLIEQPSEPDAQFPPPRDTLPFGGVFNRLEHAIVGGAEPTRLERIVCAIITGKPDCITASTMEGVSMGIVDFARALERAMDESE